MGARDRAALLARFKNLSTELENLKDRVDEESEKKSDALKALSKANAEIQLWKSKMETEAAGRIDELEMGKTKLSAALSEADKRKLESAVHTLHAEIDDALAQAKGSEEKAKRAMVDAARLADELRAEQDHTAALEKGKAGLNSAMGELELNLAQANEVAAKGGRSAMAKLENRIHELEIELGAIQAKTGETFKAFQKAERHVKELQFQTDEDKKNQACMSDLAGKLQAKIKTYKTQIAEAEEIAALNLAKFRKAQQELEANEDRAKAAGAALLA